jgi:hypothetical protein
MLTTIRQASGYNFKFNSREWRNMVKKNTCKYKKATKNDNKTKTSTTKTAQKKKNKQQNKTKQIILIKRNFDK